MPFWGSKRRCNHNVPRASRYLLPDHAWHTLVKWEDPDKMNNIFPAPIKNLPEADIPLDGITAYLSQAKDHQVIFMQFKNDVDLPEHSHAAQVGFVLSGKIELTIDGIKNEYGKGNIYFIPDNVKHSGKVYAGYADITFFNEANRYKEKK